MGASCFYLCVCVCLREGERERFGRELGSTLACKEQEKEKEQTVFGTTVRHDDAACVHLFMMGGGIILRSFHSGR